MDNILDHTAEELMDAITHREACEMFLEVRKCVNDMDSQMEKLLVYAKCLELEKRGLLTTLEKYENMR